MIHLPRRATSVIAAVLLGAAVVGCAAPLATGTPTAVAPTPDVGSCPASQPSALGAGQTRTVNISTSMGSITIKIEADLAPIATGNFVALAACGFYDGVVFHRLVPGFVIQGGDPSGSGSGGPGYTIADDPVTTAYHRGTVAMARSSAPHSEGSQFFIVLSDDAAPSLASANTYAILGEVTAGMDAVDEIASMPNSGSPDNTALQPIAMTNVTVTNP